MKNLLFICILAFLIANICFAESITGTVVDEQTGNSIAGANIVLKGTKLGAATDSEGRFAIDGLEPGNYGLKVTSQGYSSKSLKDIVVGLEGIELTIQLEPKAIEGREVVVTSTRRPIALKDVPEIVLSIPSEQIEQIEPRDISDIIYYAPGVSVEGGTGSGQPYDKIVSIDGLPANYSLVMMNGARVVSSHWHTGANVNIVPAEAVERIEVVKGAASAQYGSEGLGGTINILTKRGDDRPQMLFNARGGDRKSQYYSLLLNGPVNEKISYNTFSSWEKTDGDSVLAPAHRLGQLGYEKFTSLHTVDAEICSEATLQTQMFYLQSFSNFRGAEYKSWLITPKIGLNYSIGDDIEVDLAGYYTQWNGEINSEKNEIAEPQLTVGYNGLKDNYLLAGGEWIYRNFRRTSVDEQEQTATGVFLQDEWTPHHKLSLLAALRFDKVEDIEGVITPKLSARYNPVEPVNVRLSVGRGFRAPTVQDLYEQSYGHGDYRREGNPELEPEYSTGINGGIEFQPFNRLNILIDGYYTAMTDMITPVYDHTDVIIDSGETIDTTELAVYIRQNIHEATIYGGEIKIAYNFFRNFEFEGSVNYTYNENRETETSLPYYPGLTTSLRLSGEEKINSWLEIGGFVGMNMATGRKVWNWNDIATETELEDYTKIDAGLNFTFADRYELYGRIDNILGEEIHMYEDLEMIIAGIPKLSVGIRIRAFR